MSGELRVPTPSGEPDTLVDFRKAQAERWARSRGELPVTTPSVSYAATATSSELPKVTPREIREVSISPNRENIVPSISIDRTSIESITTFLTDTHSGLKRCGLAFGTVKPDGHVIVDALYECSQDSEGTPLHDSRILMVKRVSQTMSLVFLGMFYTPMKLTEKHYRLALEGDINLVIKIGFTALEAKQLSGKCVGLLKAGKSTEGQEGLLTERIELQAHEFNDVIHCGFYRLNRPNHVPTCHDAKAFLAARQLKTDFKELSQQCADYHFILFIADRFGETEAERIILSIYLKEDHLIEELVSKLLDSDDVKREDV